MDRDSRSPKMEAEGKKRVCVCCGVEVRVLETTIMSLWELSLVSLFLSGLEPGKVVDGVVDDRHGGRNERSRGAEYGSEDRGQ